MLRDRFIIMYAAAVFVAAFLMSSLGVQRLEIYYSVYLIVFLVFLELTGSFKRSLTVKFQPIALAFFLGFIYIVAQQVFQILASG